MTKGRLEYPPDRPRECRLLLGDKVFGMMGVPRERGEESKKGGVGVGRIGGRMIADILRPDKCGEVNPLGDLRRSSLD